MSKSTVEHTMKYVGPSPALSLLRYCVLHTLPDRYPTADIYRIKVLQRAYRRQYYRIIDDKPEHRHHYTYNLNCSPVGVKVTPGTRVCNNPKICPWCFVRRRLLPIYEALTQPPTKIRNLHKVVTWRRVLPINSKQLPFLRADYGPHTWCKALVTVQTVVPFLDKNTQELYLYHVGLQIVPKDCDTAALLTRKAVIPPIRFADLEGKANKTNILRAMTTTLQFPWPQLYDRENLQSFVKLIDSFKRQQLVRVSQYQLKEGEKRGN